EGTDKFVRSNGAVTWLFSAHRLHLGLTLAIRSRGAASGSRGRQWLEGELLAVVIDADAAVLGDPALEQLGRQWVLNSLLNDALQRPRAVSRTIAFAGDRLTCRVGDFHPHVVLLQPLRVADNL